MHGDDGPGPFIVKH